MNTQNSNPLKDALNTGGQFAVTWEQVPGRATRLDQIDGLIRDAEKAAKGGRVHAVSITDNPGGSPALSAEILAVEVKKLGVEPLVHLALRDKNRIQVETILYSMAVHDIENILVISGDYSSTEAFKGRSLPAFDLDPAHVMELVDRMNCGMEYRTGKKTQTLPPTSFFPGVGVSPFKQLEAETVCQYYKLEKKIKAGARFSISQVGYDARKMHELVLWHKYMGYNVPVMANIYVLSYGSARAMHENRIPGAVVTRELMETLDKERQAADKGRSARLERASRMYALARGMGYSGVHIGGFGLEYEDLEQIILRGQELAPNWMDYVPEFNYPQKDGYYFFEKDEATGLNREEETGLLGKGHAPLSYRFARIVHEAFFDPHHPFFGLYQKAAAWADKSTFRRDAFEKISHLAKTGLFNCLDCGDCALFDLAYLCPVSQCPKERRLGPCGGSFEGWCEVYPGYKRCIWVRAYDRLKTYDEEDTLRAYSVPPRDWDLWQTPSQLNFYLGRDHTAKRLGIKPPESKS